MKSIRSAWGLSPTGRGRGLRTGTLAMGLALMMALMGAGAAFATHAPDDTVAQVEGPAPDGTNHAVYWVNYFQARFPGTTWECTKVNEAIDPVVSDAHDAVIIKAATTNYVWWDDPNTEADELHSGTYTAPENSTSHYFTCVNTTEPVEDFIPPTGEIMGPCADPAYYAIFDNSAGLEPVKFRFVWYNNYGKNVKTKVVPAGMIYTTWQHWVKPFTTIRIAYKHPENGWTNLDTEVAAKGRYPACPYSPGFSDPTP